MMVPPGSVDAGIASSFFHIVGLCVAIPGWIWALCALYVCHKNRGRKSVFVIVLLLNVLLQSAFSGPALVNTLDIRCESRSCTWTFALFEMTELCGLYLHQMVALESILSLRHPLYTADLFFLPCSITLSVFLYLLSFACAISRWQFGFSLPAIGILLITFNLTIKAPPPSPQHVSNASPKSRYWVLVLAVVTMILYLPNLVISYRLHIREYLDFYDIFEYLLTAYSVTFSLKSLRLISDTFLCLLVCKKALPVQTGADNQHDVSLYRTGGAP